MGAGASASQKPMSEVDIKNSIGVLYETTGAKKAFEAGKDADGKAAWAAGRTMAYQGRAEGIASKTQPQSLRRIRRIQRNIRGPLARDDVLQPRQ
jgi:hypothetical protein